MTERKDPEIIDVEYEVLEEGRRPAGEIIDVNPVPDAQEPPRAQRRPPPATPGGLLTNILGEFLNTPVGKAAALGLGLYGVAKAYDDHQRKKRKKVKKVRRKIRRYRRRL